MKKLCLFLCLSLFCLCSALAQTSIKLSTSEGTNNEDLMHVLQLQDIQLSKVQLNGTDLIGKNFQINIRDFVNGKLVKSYLVYDSKEDGLFTFKEKEFSFSVLTKKVSSNKMRIDFRFNGFAVSKVFEVKPKHQDFILKNFQGNLDGINIPLNTKTSFLTLMMPYSLANKALRYVDTGLTEVLPEEIGKKYSVARYFLLDINIE